MLLYRPQYLLQNVPLVIPDDLISTASTGRQTYSAFNSSSRRFEEVVYLPNRLHHYLETTALRDERPQSAPLGRPTRTT